MRIPLTANQVKGRAIGATFFALFGALWVFLALYAKEVLNIVNLTWVGVTLIVLLAAVAWLFRQASRFPTAPEDPARGRTFMWINVLQWIAIALVAFVFARMHMDAYVMSAITAIVGLHMFPLARLFRYPMHFVTGGVLVAWSALSAWRVPVEHLQGTTAMGTGIILILSACVTLALAWNVVQREGSAASARQTAPDL